MKEIMISIKPEYVEKILNGQKTIEIRKSKPSCELPCKVYIYCTKANDNFVKKCKTICNKYYESKYLSSLSHKLYNYGIGKVVAYFTLNKVETLERDLNDWLPKNRYDISNELLKDIKLNQEQLWKYGQGKTLYAWHIDNLKIYDEPRELSEFYKNNYKKIIDELEFNGYDEKHCKFAVGNSFIGDDGYCDYTNCPKLKLQTPPRNYCYVESSYVEN